MPDDLDQYFQCVEISGRWEYVMKNGKIVAEKP